MGNLDFDNNINELISKIEELKKFSSEQNMDISYEISRMEKKLINAKKQIFCNLTPWQKLSLARHVDRPNSLEYINYLFTDFLELHGDRYYGDDPSIVSGIAEFKGIPVTVIGQQKGKNTKENIERNFGMPHPEGYRKALRLMKQAEKFHRPVICFIDTPGAFCGIEAEERGQGEAIAQCLFESSDLNTPIISIVIGEGGSGGALALSVADRILMLEHSVYSILSPEGFATILWKEASKAREAADIMKITAQDLLNYGIIDEIIKEPIEGAHTDFTLTCENIKEALNKNIIELIKKPQDKLVEERFNKFRSIGNFYN